MPTITQVGNPSNSYTSSPLKWEEFLPIIANRNPTEEEFNNGGIVLTKIFKEEVTLSKYLDNNKLTSINGIETEKKKFTIYFTVKQGADTLFKDDDGYIEPIIQFKNDAGNIVVYTEEDIKIISDKKILAKYGTDISVEIEITAEESKEFYLDFFANDDEDTFEGEYENVFCGRVKVVFEVYDSRVFLKHEFLTYRKYIEVNSLKSGDYGYGEIDKHDCVTAVNRSLRILLNDNKIPAKANMDIQMLTIENLNYGISSVEIYFKDSDNQKTKGITDPSDYYGDKLSTILNKHLASNNGYYFFGMSIMDGFHSVMIVVNKYSDTIKYNIFDQHGSVLGNTKKWFNRSSIDTWLLDYVSFGNTTHSGEKGKIITKITQIKHK